MARTPGSSISDVVNGQRRWAILHGDCIPLLAAVSPASAHIVLADPPYGMRWRSHWRKNDPRPLHQQRVLNDDQAFVWWIGLAARTLAPRGALLCFCRWDGQEYFRSAILTAGLRLRSQVIWDRQSFGLGSAPYRVQHDVIWVATRGHCTPVAHDVPSVISVPRIFAARAVHPTQKPVDLLARLLRPFARPDRLVLDPFAGSGSAGLAALSLGMRYLGFELEPAHCRTARTRLHAVGSERS